jgi:hypothetical protein
VGREGTRRRSRLLFLAEPGEANDNACQKRAACLVVTVVLLLSTFFLSALLAVLEAEQQSKTGVFIAEAPI